MSKKKKKKKLKVSRLLIALFFILLAASLLILLSKIPVKGYYISGNTYYTDLEILQKTGLEDYPSYLLTTSSSVNSKIKDDNLIESITIKKDLKGRFTVKVKENKILFYDNVNKKSILENAEESDYYYEYSPILINEINDEEVYEKFIKKMKLVDDDVYKSISEIKYDPSDLDDEKFLLSMNDGNYVYLTLSKFKNINNYLEIAETLKDQKGILYLDYGNYFVPKE